MGLTYLTGDQMQQHMTSQEEFAQKDSPRENSMHDYLMREYDPKTQK